MEKSIYTSRSELICEKLVALRKRAKMSQRQLARKLRLDPATIARIEKGQRRIDLAEFATICETCGAQPDKVFAELYRRFKTL